MSKAKQKKKEQHDIATQKFQEGLQMVEKHPLFHPLLQEVYIWRNEEGKYPENGLATAASDGYIYCNPKRRAEPE